MILVYLESPRPEKTMSLGRGVVGCLETTTTRVADFSMLSFWVRSGLHASAIWKLSCSTAPPSRAAGKSRGGVKAVAHGGRLGEFRNYLEEMGMSLRFAGCVICLGPTEEGVCKSQIHTVTMAVCKN